MNNKVLGVFALAMINLVIVGNLQMLTTTAVYGYSLFFYYAIAAITFFIPCCLITSELATRWPINGGAYIWVEQAFGQRAGFFAASIQWLCNLIWYPTIFSLIATGFVYLFKPELANSNVYIFVSVTLLFWSITLLNCLGIRISSVMSSMGALVGIVLPCVLMTILALIWLTSGKPSQIPFSASALLPNLKANGNLAFLIEVVISLVGIEMAAVHAGNVKNAARNFPRAIFFSAILIMLILIGAALAIAIVIPSTQIALVSGILDAFSQFLRAFHLSILLPCFILLFTLGNLGSVAAWMMSSTRGMQVASIRCNMPIFMQKTNRFDAPMGILVLEAIVFTLVSGLFLLLPAVNNAYWTLLDMASQITLIYYVLLFLSALRLRYKAGGVANSFKIPGNAGMGICVALGSISSLLAIGFGFLPPAQMPNNTVFTYQMILIIGMIIACIIPFLLLLMAKLNNTANLVITEGL